MNVADDEVFPAFAVEPVRLFYNCQETNKKKKTKKKRSSHFFSLSSIILLNHWSDQLHFLSTYNWVLIDRIDQQVIEVQKSFESVVMDFDFYFSLIRSMSSMKEEEEQEENRNLIYDEINALYFFRWHRRMFFSPILTSLFNVIELHLLSSGMNGIKFRFFENIGCIF